MELELAVTLPNDFWSWQTALFLVASFVYGSIPFAFIFTFLFTRKKLNETGTGNIGVANAFGVGGLPAGFLSVVGEASKGILPILVSHWFYNGSLVTSLIFITVEILAYGNSFFLKGRGGQGGTILMWALLVLSPYTLLAYVIVTGVAYLIIRRRRLASSLGYIFLPVAILFIEQDLVFVIFGAFMAAYYIIRYKPQQSDYAYYKSRMRYLHFFEKFLGEKPSLIKALDNVKNASEIGFKAYSLKILKKNRAKIPQAYICPFSVFRRYRDNDPEIMFSLKTDLHKVIRKNTRYSVRSSANLEDSEAHSFAGQFVSFLNIETVEDIQQSIVNVWDSIKTNHVKTYLNQIGRMPDDLQMAVIVQEMINARFSGVIFTKNPVTGFDEVIIEAVSGPGDRLYSPAADLKRWVYKWGHWLEKPENPGIDETVIKTIISEAQGMAVRYGKQVNLEWVYDGNTIYWLQLRPITSLHGINIYSNKISKEFLPGMIKPLVWTINIRVVNSAWKKVLVELMGNDAANLDIESLAKSIYYRAYFNMGIMGDMFELLGMPRELLEVLIGLEIEKERGPSFRPGLSAIKYFPRLIIFTGKLMVFKKKIRHFLKNYDVLFHDAALQLDNLKEEDAILRSIDRLIISTSNASYFVIVTILLMSIFNRLIKILAGRYKVDTKSMDFLESRAGISDIEPNYFLGQLNAIYRSLPESEKEKFKHGEAILKNDSVSLNRLCDKMAEFLDKFGHLSESGNDFSRLQWKETPELAKNMIINFVPKDKKEHSGDYRGIKDKLPRNPFFRFVYRNAIAYREYRERVNYIYTYGYGLFRQYFLRVGSLWQEKKYINDKEDIFYLTHDEIKGFRINHLPSNMIKEKIAQRKNEMERVQNIRLPSVIVGDLLPPEVHDFEVSAILYGIPASKGYCTGKTTVISTVKDFHKMHTGDVLVIPHSDISWTPLFTGAKGVISESGGMLSHCSIIAREYGIPAVVSVPGAMNLQDGITVTLDGDKGEVLLQD
jgi:glycerol-3-phosphate acyltransferase PlsY/phosphohistidine swiveling domain-containing protein